MFQYDFFNKKWNYASILQILVHFLIVIFSWEMFWKDIYALSPSNSEMCQILMH